MNLPVQSPERPFSLDTVRELKGDLRLLADGAKIHSVVDAHDLIAFCFPLGIFRHAETAPLPSGNDIANAQIAFHALFYKTTHPPFLLNEYAHELEALRSYLAWQIQNVYTTLAVVNRITDTSVEPDPDDPRLVRLAAEDFKLVLAVATGLISCGLQQWSDILRHRVVNQGQMTDGLKQQLADYVPSPVFESIRNTLLTSLPRSAQKAETIDLRRRAAHRDASAVDKILFLNGAHRPVTSANGVRGRHFFFYASSASRSSMLFDTRDVQGLLPVVKGERIRILKGPPYWYAYAVHRIENEVGGLDVEATIAALDDTEKVLKSLAEWKKNETRQEKCGDCVQDGKEGLSGKDGLPCEFVTECRRICRLTHDFNRDRRRLSNLSLSAKMASYQDVIDAVEKEHAAALRAHPTIARRVALLKTVHADAGYPDLALNRMEDLRNLMDWLVKEDGEDATGTNDSHITVVDQRLPISLNFPDPEYQQVWHNVRAYYVSGASQRGKMRDRLDEGLSHFRKLETEGLTRSKAAQYQLLRSVISLAFPKQDGDREAYKLASKGATEYREFDLEFMCVATWAARRLGDFELADWQATRAIRQHGQDARLYHGLALNAFAWKMSEPDNPARKLADAIEYVNRAIELYTAGGLDANRNLIAANLHNLAFFSTCDPADPAFDVARGRAAIERLKQVLPKETWSIRLPEYHHGEALVEVREFQQEYAANGNRNIEYLRKKLMAARSEIDVALATQTKRIYLELREEIEREVERRGGAPPPPGVTETDDPDRDGWIADTDCQD